MAASPKTFFFDGFSNGGRDLVRGDVLASFVDVTIVKRIGIDANLRSSFMGDDPNPDEFICGVVHFENVQRFLVLRTDRYAQAIEARDLVGVSSPQVFTQGLVGETSG